jgi:hypothetical protein
MVTFIPKPRKANCTKVKAYRPISLSYFMLKTMEKLVEKDIRDEILGLHPLHWYKFACRLEKSTGGALHHVIMHIEEAVENGDVTLGTFWDIEGAIDGTSFDILTEDA